MSASDYRWLDNDSELMKLIAGATGHVPATVVRMGRALFTWRTVDEELSALQAENEGPAPPHGHAHQGCAGHEVEAE